jgi:hypothetical protein
VFNKFNFLLNYSKLSVRFIIGCENFKKIIKNIFWLVQKVKKVKNLSLIEKKTFLAAVIFISCSNYYIKFLLQQYYIEKNHM